MKAWWTARELAPMSLPGLGGSERHIRRLAEEQGWSQRKSAGGKPLSRERQGRGGGLEYHYAVLPAVAQAGLAMHGHLGSGLGAASPEQPRLVATADEAWAAFDALPESRKSVARFRMTVLDEVASLERGGFSSTAAVTQVVALHAERGRSGEEPKFGAATVYSWKALVRPLKRPDWLPALAPRNVGRTATAAFDEAAWEYLRGDYLRLSGPSFETCCRRLEAKATEAGWRLPSSKTLKRRLDALPAGVTVLARQGLEAAERLYPPMIRDRSMFHALEAVNADGHRWDVFVKWPDEDKPVRPLMLAIQDLYSGKVVAWRLAKSESADVVQLAFGDLFRDWGVPQHVWLDNGRGFASKWITGGAPTRYRFKVKPSDPVGVLTQLGVNVRWTKPYSGQSKPIERAFRDLCDAGAKHPAFEGAYTGNTPNAKPENYGSRAVPLDEFEAVVTNVINEHNQRQGRRTRVCRGVLSFDQAFTASFEQAIVRRASEAQLRMCLLAAEPVTADRLSGAVTLAGNRYWAPFLNEHRGDKLVLRVDPLKLHDDAEIYSLAGKHLGTAEIWEAAGFGDMEAGRKHARLKAEHIRATKALLRSERKLSAAQVAALLPDIADEDFTPEPSRVVRLAPTRGNTALQLQSNEQEASQEAVIDRLTRAVGRLSVVE